ncbi:hypothetical protein GTQ43_16180 [Nostoc sp. KVJ3]|uniref:tetratricopeptide repeat protein n=1 Tax=Nostoc sp. KVJ3 TaxID=457945 RepID=UPI002238D954|nr:tetratricopeptide repeat protein [Nostoc sp. KVJ3]MCW5315293.1 hypothetical protein [Nostoc sp. KVJ3]
MKAIEKVKDDQITKTIVDRNYAEFLFLVDRNLEGREYFSKSISALEKMGGSDLKYDQLGITYQRWGLNELWKGDTTEADKYFEKAAKEYHNIRTEYIKTDALNDLHNKTKGKWGEKFT